MPKLLVEYIHCHYQQIITNSSRLLRNVYNIYHIKNCTVAIYNHHLQLLAMCQQLLANCQCRVNINTDRVLTPTADDK